MSHAEAEKCYSLVVNELDQGMSVQHSILPQYSESEVRSVQAPSSPAVM